MLLKEIIMGSWKKACPAVPRGLGAGLERGERSGLFQPPPSLPINPPPPAPAPLQRGVEMRGGVSCIHPLREKWRALGTALHAREPKPAAGELLRKRDLWETFPLGGGAAFRTCVELATGRWDCFWHSGAFGLCMRFPVAI